MRRLLLLLCLAFPLQADEVRVFAAASLADVLQDLARQYKGADRVLFNFGASGLLARQIELGAPADLFLSADPRPMTRLEQLRRIDPATRTTLLSNTLVVVVPADRARRFSGPSQLLTLRSIAIGDAASVPAGAYAKEYLTREGLWPRLEARIVPAANVRAALAAVESGNVDAAIVYRTDALLTKRAVVAMEIPAARAPAIAYPFALVADAENRQGGLRFLKFLSSDAARRTFARYGFLLLPR
jgi:molybdate transport system substrate-binding protein